MEQKPSKKFWGTTWRKFIFFNRLHRLIRPGDRVLALVSGGPDSTAMAYWFKLLGAKISFEWAIAHFDHGLRPDSERITEQVRRLAQSLNVPFYAVKIPVASYARKQRRSLEDAGRKLRYDAAIRLARRFRFNRVAAAHTLDEQAESVLINILRGGSLKGLAGARISRPIKEGSRVFLIRPMLAVTKEEARAYLKAQGVRFFEDPANRDPRFLRGRIRRELLPKLKELQPKAVEHLASLALERN